MQFSFPNDLMYPVEHEDLALSFLIFITIVKPTPLKLMMLFSMARSQVSSIAPLGHGAWLFGLLHLRGR